MPELKLSDYEAAVLYRVTADAWVVICGLRQAGDINWSKYSEEDRKALQRVYRKLGVLKGD